jgi:hypothetical protein
LVETGIGIADEHDADQAVDSGPACVSQRRRRGATPAPLNAVCNLTERLLSLGCIDAGESDDVLDVFSVQNVDRVFG